MLGDWGFSGTALAQDVSQYGKVPAFFIENKGQADNKVKYYFKGNDNVYFTDEGVVFQKIETRECETEVKELNVWAGLPRPYKDGETTSVPSRALAYKLEFIGTRPTSPQARNELKGKVNYLIGNDRFKWHTNIPTYQEIVYPNLYPAHSSLVQSSSIEPNVSVQATSLNQQDAGIDLVYKGVPGGMKYEFIVQPGADPDVIQLAYTGIEWLSIDDAGNLIIRTALGDVKDSKPYCYQEIDGKKVEVRCNFVIRNDVGAGLALPNNKGAVSGAPTQFVYGFEVSSYNKNYPLVIDPGLEYSTFLGESGTDYDGYVGIAVDGSGNAYVMGYTDSSGFPTTAGAFDTGFNGTRDAFVSKLNTTGTALEYSTFLGGGDWDWGLGIAIDGSGNAYVTGFTDSSDFPTTAGAFDTSHNGSRDAFVSKLNAAGTALEYSTFLGGSGFEVGFGIAVDGSGNAYVTGFTSSSDFPTTAGAYDTSYNGGGNDAFVTKLNTAGTALEYSTFLGGSSTDWGYGIAVDGSGNAYVTGYTSSSGFPTTAGAFDTSYNGNFNAFVSKLNTTGTALEYSTFLGGSYSYYDSGNGIAVDGSGNAYVTGETYSSDFPTTTRAYDETHNGSGDAFVAKFSFTEQPLVENCTNGIDDDGDGLVDCEDSDCAGNPACITPPSTADFSCDPEQGEAPLTVHFTNNSTGDIDTCEWDFGDGTSIVTGCDDQEHTYLDEGTYIVSLTVTGPGGTDTAECTIEVTEAPVEDCTNGIDDDGDGLWTATTLIV